MGQTWLGLDTETSGLDPITDKLLLIQIATQEDKIFLVRFPSPKSENLIKVLSNQLINFIAHHAMFDLKFLYSELNVLPRCHCTKTLAKLAYPNLLSGLGSVLKKALNVKINKEITFDWEKEKLTKRDIEYAVEDSRYLIKLWNKLYDFIYNKDDERLENYWDVIDILSVMTKVEIDGYTDLFVHTTHLDKNEKIAVRKEKLKHIYLQQMETKNG